MTKSAKETKPSTEAKAATGAKPAAPQPLIPASLEHMSVSLFGCGLGLAGFATAWRESSATFGIGHTLALLLTGIAFGVFLVLVALYCVKVSRHREAVRAELKHPVQGNFIAAVPMTLMILASAIGASAPELVAVIWALSALCNIGITVAIVTHWIARDSHVSQTSPIWFIPIVGNLIIPIVGVPLGYYDIGWMVFAVGLLFWLILFAIVFYRLLFERPLENPLRPSLFILIAPPSLCFIAYVILNGGAVDGMAKMFFGIACFIALVLLAHIPTLIRLPFSMGWWAYTFPLAAFSIASTLYADAVGGVIANSLAVAVMAILNVVVLVVVIHTIRYILAGKVFRPVEDPLPAA